MYWFRPLRAVQNRDDMKRTGEGMMAIIDDEYII